MGNEINRDSAVYFDSVAAPRAPPHRLTLRGLLYRLGGFSFRLFCFTCIYVIREDFCRIDYTIRLRRKANADERAKRALYLEVSERDLFLRFCLNHFQPKFAN